MKQHITPKQMLEVKEEQFYSFFNEIVKRKDWFRFHHEKMNIGKMIEILNEKSISVQIKTTVLDTKDGKRAFISLDNVFDSKYFSSGTLCDALWEAVKQTL